MSAMPRLARRLAVILAPVALIACAQPEPKIADTFFVVLPNEAGTAGAITVTQDGKTEVLDRPYAAAQVTRKGTLEPVHVSDADVQQIFGAALSAQPELPREFLLYFQLDKNTLVPESLELVDEVLADIAARPSYTVEVVGHTDRAADEEYNQRLSQERAETIRDLLVGLGADAATISIAGRGELDLLVPTADGVAEPRNRRVEVTVR